MPNIYSESAVGSPQMKKRNSEQNDHPRVVIMGASGVGKTSIVEQFLYERFPLDHIPTVEELHVNVYAVSGSTLTLDLLDTSGSYEFPAMRQLAIKTADAFILVYSIVDRDSFNYVSSIRDLIMEVREGNKNTPIVVVGNKADLEDLRVMRKEVTESIVTMDWENGFVECSAKENNNILKIFDAVLQQAHICYALSKAVEQRRKSCPSTSPYPKIKNAIQQKRHSCAMQ